MRIFDVLSKFDRHHFQIVKDVITYYCCQAYRRQDNYNTPSVYNAFQGCGLIGKKVLYHNGRDLCLICVHEYDKSKDIRFFVCNCDVFAY
jgi:hypothetical protein